MIARSPRSIADSWVEVTNRSHRALIKSSIRINPGLTVTENSGIIGTGLHCTVTLLLELLEKGYQLKSATNRRGHPRHFSNPAMISAPPFSLGILVSLHLVMIVAMPTTVALSSRLFSQQTLAIRRLLLLLLLETLHLRCPMFLSHFLLWHEKNWAPGVEAFVAWSRKTHGRR